MKKTKTLAGLLAAASLCSVAWLDQVSHSIGAGTNAAQVVSNTVPEVGYFRRAVAIIPCGVTGLTVQAVDALDGYSFFSTNVSAYLAGNTNNLTVAGATTNLDIWATAIAPTNVLHGSYINILSSELAITNAIRSNVNANVGINVNTIEDR